MADLQQLEITAQLLDNLSIAVREMEKYYNENNNENFIKSKKEILEIQNKISKINMG
jgi:hypothetical protein